MTNHIMMFVAVIAICVCTANSYNVQPKQSIEETELGFGFAIATQTDSESSFIVTSLNSTEILGTARFCSTGDNIKCGDVLKWNSDGLFKSDVDPDYKELALRRFLYGASVTYGKHSAIVGAPLSINSKTSRTSTTCIKYQCKINGALISYESNDLAIGELKIVDYLEKVFMHPRSGFSMAKYYTRRNEQVLFGLPGDHKGDGTMDTQKMTDFLPKRTAKYEWSPFINGKQLYYYSGYAVAAADLNNDGNIDFMSGAPRSYILMGAVFIYMDSSNTYVDSLVGDQMGAYFGSSLVTGDFNNDNGVDVCVGASQYYLPDVPDAGQVTCFFNNPITKALDKKVPVKLYGNTAHERFGFSLAVGDFDRDGFKDLVVGAPFYEKKDQSNGGQGRIFIYYGKAGKNGISTECQIIEGTNPNSRFGFSLATFDGKGGDLLVGAPGISKVYRYVGLPIANVQVEMTTSLEKDMLSKGQAEFEVNIIFKNHHSNYDIPVSTVKYTLKFDGVEVTRGTVPALSSNTIFRVNAIKVLVTKDFYDWETIQPMPLILSWMNDKDTEIVLKGKRSETTQILFNTGCGFLGAEACLADLNTTMVSDHHVVVQGDNAIVTVKVTNNGPYLALSNVIQFESNSFFDIVDYSKNNESVTCMRIVNTIICKLDSMEESEFIMFNVTLKTLNLPFNGTTVTVSATTISKPSESTGASDQSKASVRIFPNLDGDADISGTPTVEVPGNISSQILKGRITHKHVYYIRNTGIGFPKDGRKPDVRDVTVDIYWPLGFLYPVSFDLSDVSGICDTKYVDCARKSAKYKGEPFQNENVACPVERTECMANQTAFPMFNISEEHTSSVNGTSRKPNVINCSNWSKFYVKMTCTVNVLSSNEIAIITIGSVPNTDVLDNNRTGLNPYGYTWAPSFAVITVGSEENMSPSLNVSANNYANAVTFLRPALDPPPIEAEKKSVPIWIIIVSSVGGLLLVICIVAGLKKAGFFVRKGAPPLLDDCDGGDGDGDGDGDAEAEPEEHA